MPDKRILVRFCSHNDKNRKRSIGFFMQILGEKIVKRKNDCWNCEKTEGTNLPNTPSPNHRNKNGEKLLSSLKNREKRLNRNKKYLVFFLKVYQKEWDRHLHPLKNNSWRNKECVIYEAFQQAFADSKWKDLNQKMFCHSDSFLPKKFTIINFFFTVYYCILQRRKSHEYSEYT